MESLPDDVWIKILRIGTETGRLEHNDICALTIVNSQFDQLTQDASLWAILLSRDFPTSLEFSQAPSKTLYRELLETEREIESRIKQLREELRYSFDQFLLWQSPFPAFQLDETYSYGSSSQNNATRVNFELPQLNVFDSIVGNDMDVLPLHEEGSPALSNANHPSLRQGHNHHYEKKPSKRFDKSSRPKVIPMSKSYIPMNRPPRRSMPRKI